MSLFSSMNTAISGLSAQSRSLGHISDNLANSTTIGYKRLDTSFQSMVTVSNAAIHHPGAVTAQPIRHTGIQGPVEQTQTGTNLSINGPGFFNVSQASVGADGSTDFDMDLFTRAGDFQLDKHGFLTNGAGLFLNGQQVVDPQTGRVDNRIEPIKVTRLRDEPIQTSFVDYRANLPATAVDADDIDAATGDIEYSPTQTRVYDPLGRERELNLAWTRLDPTDPANANRWRLNVSMPGADLNGAGADADREFYVQFGASGPARGTIEWISDTNAAPAPLPAAGSPASPALTITETDGSAWDFDLRLGTIGETGGVTQFASNGIESVRTDQNGAPVGALANLSFDEFGFLHLNYDNGRSVPAFKVPVAIFDAPGALRPESKTAFRATYASGQPAILSAGERGAGMLVPLSLEGSNVDIGQEFSKMIVSQRAYSANARVVTVTDRMLEETLSMAR